MPSEMSAVKHCASIDLEDWYYDVEHVVPADFTAFSQAFDRQLQRIETILDQTHVRCTFFTLGRTAERYPEWIRRLHGAGHEIATHGYGHDKLPVLNPESFRQDVRRSLSVIADITGVRPQGYRAPYFSLGADQSWVYEILVEEGLSYSSSVFPFPGRHYGIGSHPVVPVRVSTKSGSLIEMPLSVIVFGGRRIPVAGGGFWRAIPTAGVEFATRRIASEGRGLVLYLHPHEFDTQSLRSHRGLARNLYVNLGRRSVAQKLEHVLKRFSFAPVSAVVAGLGEVPEMSATAAR
jgi:polysaccharide deacetylase family protein (PEP-CTERM system associated)